MEEPPILDGGTEAVRPTGMARTAAAASGLFLAVFLVDGVLSVLAVVPGGKGVPLLASLVTLTSWLLLLGGMLLLAASALTPLVPKRIVVPWFLLLLASLPWASDPANYLFLNLAETALAAGLIHAETGGRGLRWPWVSAASLAGPAFTWRNLLLSTGVGFFVLAPLAAVCLLCLAARQIEGLSGGFIHFHWNRLAMEARHYSRADGKAVELIPMMHLGEREFYRDVDARIPKGATVLLEGVSDRQRKLPHGLDYTPVARNLGMSSQREAFHPDGSGGVVRSGDVDVSDLSPRTLRFITLLSGFTNRPSWRAFVRFQAAWKREQMADPQAMTHVMDDILARRNAHVLGEMRRELARTDAVVLAWGALHMPGLEKGVLAENFTADGRGEEIEVLRFGVVLAGLLHAPPPPPRFVPPPPDDAGKPDPS